MIADLRAFGSINIKDANFQLKENLKAVKTQAEALLHLMDLTIKRINFESDEVDKWVALREAILNFRTLEVNPSIAQNVMISKENMDKLEDVYGAYTEAAINRIINDLIEEADEKFKNKHRSKFKKAMDQIAGAADQSKHSKYVR